MNKYFLISTVRQLNVKKKERTKERNTVAKRREKISLTLAFPAQVPAALLQIPLIHFLIIAFVSLPPRTSLYLWTLKSRDSSIALQFFASNPFFQILSPLIGHERTDLLFLYYQGGFSTFVIGRVANCCLVVQNHLNFHTTSYTSRSHIHNHLHQLQRQCQETKESVLYRH